MLVDEVAQFDLLEEGEYLDLLEKLPKDNQFLEDSDPNKFIAKMGAEAIYDLLSRLDLDALSYELRHRAGSDASQQRKNEALKTFSRYYVWTMSGGLHTGILPMLISPA